MELQRRNEWENECEDYYDYNWLQSIESIIILSKVNKIWEELLLINYYNEIKRIKREKNINT